MSKAKPAAPEACAPTETADEARSRLQAEIEQLAVIVSRQGFRSDARELLVAKQAELDALNAPPADEGDGDEGILE